MELTKEHFDQAVKGLATQESVNVLATRMTNVESTLRSHTSSLEQLVTKKKTKDDEKTIETHRPERMERAIEDLAGKVGLKLDW